MAEVKAYFAYTCEKCNHSLLAHNGFGCLNSDCACKDTAGRRDKLAERDGNQLSLFD